MNLLNLLLVLTLLSTAPILAQNRGGYSFFYLVNSGRKAQKRQLSIDQPTSAIVFYGQDTLQTLVRFDKEMLFFSPATPVQKISLTDTALKEIILLDEAKKQLILRPILNKEAKWMRVIFDSLGLALYDDVYRTNKSPEEVDYDELIIAYQGHYYPVTDFWTTSRKRKMVDILNKVFGGNLAYSEFKNKEDVLESVVTLKNRVLRGALQRGE